MRYHYVYKVTDPKTGEFYIGSRTSDCIPEEDDYMGSWTVWEPEDESRLEKDVYGTFESRDKAFKKETLLIKSVIGYDLNRNYHIPKNGFHTVGSVTVKDEEGNTFQVSKDDPRYLSGSLKHNILGTQKSEQARKKMSEARKEYYKRNPSFNKGKNNPRSRKVRVLKTGEVFDTLTSCAEAKSVTLQTVSDHCCGRRKTAKYEFI